MGKLLGYEPCPSCRSKGNDKTGNNLAVYEDGKYCYACSYTPDKEHKQEGQLMTQQYVPWRGLTAQTLKKFNCPVLVSEDGVPQEVQIAFPHGTQYRSFEGKNFRSAGDMSTPQLFGEDLFPAGSAKAVTIYEGAADAMSGFQILGNYPSVSVRSASSARKDCAARLEYLNSFEKIYLCLDNDDAGRKATMEIANLFDFNKVFHVKLGKFKDANDFLQAGESKTFSQIWWNAKRFLPDNIVSSYSEIEAILSAKKVEAHAHYPFKRLESMTYGMRPGEAILVKAPEGIGKTEILRAIEYHNLITSDHNIGVIHLEESKDRAIKGLTGYHLRTPVHLPDSMVSPDQIVKAFHDLTKRDNRVHLYTHFGSDNPDDILGAIRFLGGACECRVVFLDHISMVVSGLETDDERKKLDYISTHLKMMAEKLGFTIVFVSHVNDAGQTRGSRNISKIADLVVKLDRDLTADDENIRNTTYLTVEKNRFTGLTGPAGSLTFNRDSFTLMDTEETFGTPPVKAA